MIDEIQALKQVRRFQRDATEQLMTDSRLREALTDTQAETLLDWALTFVNKGAQQTAGMSTEGAEVFMEEMVTAVSRFLRLFNKLVTNLSRLDDEEAVAQVEQLMSNWRDLTGLDAILTPTDLLAVDRQTWDNDEIFQRLIIMTQELDPNE